MALPGGNFRALRGFAIDLGLSGVAGALGWHPVYDYLSEHRGLVYWGVGSIHMGLISLIAFMALVGNTKASDLISSQRGSLHERLDTWSLVLTICASFVVPFVCGLLSARAGTRCSRWEWCSLRSAPLSGW